MAAVSSVQHHRSITTTACRRSGRRPARDSAIEPEAVSDLDLIGRVTSGDAVAFDTLYARHAPSVYATAVRFLRDAESAEDIRQETFVRLWRQAGGFRGERGTPAAWLLRIARNLAIDELRRRRARPQRAIDDQATLLAQAVDPHQDVERLVVARVLADAALTAMDRLPRSQRLAVELAYLRGLSHREVADTLGEPLGTVKSRIGLGAARLRASLDAGDAMRRQPPRAPGGSSA